GRQIDAVGSANNLLGEILNRRGRRSLPRPEHQTERLIDGVERVPTRQQLSGQVQRSNMSPWIGKNERVARTRQGCLSMSDRLDGAPPLPAQAGARQPGK